MTAARSYPNGVGDDEWAFAAPCLTLRRQDAPRRRHPLRPLFNAPRYRGHTGGQGRYPPNALPPWAVAHQQWTSWRAACVSEGIARDSNGLRPLLPGRSATPSATIPDGRVLQSTPGSGHRASDGSDKRRKGGKGHTAVGTPGQWLGVTTPPGHCAGARSGGPVVRTGAGRYRPSRAGGLRRPGTNRPRSRIRSGGARD